MQQIKIFESLETEISSLESEINEWLRETGAQVISMTGNIAPQSVTSHPRAKPAPSDVLLVVLYEIAE